MTMLMLNRFNFLKKNEMEKKMGFPFWVVAHFSSIFAAFSMCIIKKAVKVSTAVSLYNYYAFSLMFFSFVFFHILHQFKCVYLDKVLVKNGFGVLYFLIYCLCNLPPVIRRDFFNTVHIHVR